MDIELESKKVLTVFFLFFLLLGLGYLFMKDFYTGNYHPGAHYWKIDPHSVFKSNGVVMGLCLIFFALAMIGMVWIFL